MHHRYIQKSEEDDASVVPYVVSFARKACSKVDEEDCKSEGLEEPEERQSVLQPIVDAARYCKTKQMCLLYAPIIFTGRY